MKMTMVWISSIPIIKSVLCGYFEADIEEIVRKWNIQTVHVFISSSVSFTFYLGQLMNNNQFRKIIVYHYDNTQFIWGIDIMRSGPQKAIVWAKGLSCPSISMS
ncbi:SAVED domain-containing protein [Oscillibacter sp. GMB15532]|uniref:SAVED domain-containing protein n=1 Tax=Oscillibacter sp. GMB15532 TaxID=3230022 RepID=UPI0034DFF7B7